MNQTTFQKKVNGLVREQERLLARRSSKAPGSNGIFDRYKNPVLTAAHAPVLWRYDLNQKTNPFLLERMGIDAVFNAGAIFHEGRFLVAARVEGVDRKSFFAIAESPSGIDRFRFWDYPILMPQTAEPDTNVYDMRLVKHEDGWIYGLFCTERKDPKAPAWDTSSAVAQCGIVRTRDLKSWERLADLKSRSPQQRNVVLHPEFVDGKYAFYTRPQDEFIQAGKGGGIGWGLASQGWLHLAHGVRNTAAGLRYVLYLFLADLERPWIVTHKPAGYFLAPEGIERVGDVSNVVFSNGWIARPNGEVFLYYASSDTRLHVATSTVPRLLDYVLNTPADPLLSHRCIEQRTELIAANLAVLKAAAPSRSAKKRAAKSARPKNRREES